MRSRGLLRGVLSLVLGLLLIQLSNEVRSEIAPTFVWANRAGGPLPDSALAIAADASGNLFVAGVFGGTVTFGTTQLTAPQATDLYLAKLSPTGAWLWAKNIEALVPGIYPSQISLDSAGNPVVMATIPGDVAGDGLNQLLLAKYDTAGAPLWIKKFKPGGFSSVIGGGLAQDAANNVYITGTFGNQVNFGGVTLTDSGNGDIFLVKLSAAGATLAAKRFGQSGPVADEGQALALDTAGNLYLAASFGGTVDFGTGGLTSAGDADVALVKFNANLQPLWAKRVGNAGTDTAYELVRDSANNLVLLGSFSADTLFGTTRVTPDIAGQLVAVRLDTGGSFSWITGLGSVSAHVSGGRGLVTDGSGNTLIATGGRLQKLDANGAIVWTRQAGPSLTGVAVQNSPNLFVSGAFSGAANLDNITLNSAGSDDALIARLVINTTKPPVITVQPKSQTVLTGDNVTFSVTATGSEPLTYQWYFGTAAIKGATNASLALTNVIGSATGVYRVAVSNAGGAVTSDFAQLTVNIRPPTITQQPLSQLVDLGGNAQFTVAASGATPFFYQWQFKGVNLPNQTTSLLVIRGVRTNDLGPYNVVVGNMGGYTTSLVANLTLRLALPAITAQPQSTSVQEGATVNFSVAATGSAPLTFRWQKDGVDIPNSNSSTLTLSNVSEAQAGAYRVIVTNAAGSATSNPATLSVSKITLGGGPFTWSFLMSSACDNQILGLSTDTGGNIYLAASQPNIPIPGLTNAAGCGFGVAFARLDAEGRGIWRNLAWGTAALKVAIANLQPDATGNLLVCGSFSGANLNFGPLGGGGPTLTGGGMFLAKFGPMGNILWVKLVASVFPADLAVDAAGNCFIAGTLPGSRTTAPFKYTFGTITISTATRGPFVAKADASGNFLWVQTSGAGTTGATARSLALDASGDLWLAGLYSGTLEYDTNKFTSAFPPPSPLQRFSAFVVRLKPQDGSPKWVQSFTAGDQVVSLTRIGAQAGGGAVLFMEASGGFNYPPVTTLDAGRGMVLRLGDTGVPVTARFLESPFKDAVVNATGTILVAAELGGDSFGGLKLLRPNGQNIAAMLELDANLEPVLARSVSGLKGLEFATPTRIALSPSGESLMAGSFFGTNVVFGPVVARSSSGYGGAFLAKLGVPALPEVKAQVANNRLTLSWPLAEGWSLERVETLGGIFAPFTYSAQTNSATGTLTVDLPLSGRAEFFRLRKQ